MLCFFLLRFRGYQTLTLTLPHPRQALYRLNRQPLREVFFHQPLPHGIWENVLSALSLACHSRDGTTRYNATSLLLCLVTWFDILEPVKELSVTSSDYQQCSRCWLSSTLADTAHPVAFVTSPVHRIIRLSS